MVRRAEPLPRALCCGDRQVIVRPFLRRVFQFLQASTAHGVAKWDDSSILNAGSQQPAEECQVTTIHLCVLLTVVAQYLATSRLDSQVPAQDSGWARS